jgi:hypothetical protein
MKMQRPGHPVPKMYWTLHVSFQVSPRHWLIVISLPAQARDHEQSNGPRYRRENAQHG